MTMSLLDNLGYFLSFSLPIVPLLGDRLQECPEAVLKATYGQSSDIEILQSTTQQNGF